MYNNLSVCCWIKGFSLNIDACFALSDQIQRSCYHLMRIDRKDRRTVRRNASKDRQKNSKDRQTDRQTKSKDRQKKSKDRQTDRQRARTDRQRARTDRQTQIAGWKKLILSARGQDYRKSSNTTPQSPIPLPLILSHPHPPPPHTLPQTPGSVGQMVNGLIKFSDALR